MSSRRASLLAAGLLTASVLAAFAAAPAAAQTHTCGDIQLVFRNPDLQPSPDGYIHAQGQFFAQFQAIGERAADIEVFAFSFGPHAAEFDEQACTAPIWFTGQAVVNYRADRDPADGFFIPLVTPLVPDGEYTAAVHAYDASDNELARFWAKAVVDNCDGPDGTRCTDDAAQHANQDRTVPWPIVLPGDGTALEGRTLTIEFGEPLSWVTVHLNGENITGDLAAWDGRVWDADAVPDYGPQGVGGAVAPPCTLPVHTCMVYGPAYEWTGRALTDDDVLRVVAADVAGNRAVKDIHIGSSVAGGAITQQIPILAWTVDRTEATVDPGQPAVFRFTIENNGNADGHPFARSEVPANWSAEWQPNHVPVTPGAREAQEFIVTPPAGTPPGSYAVNASMDYQQGSAEKQLAQRLTVLVSGPAPSNSTAPEDGGGKDSPGVPAAVLAAALAAAAVAVRRRRA